MLKLQLPANYKNFDALVIEAKDNYGKEIYKWTGVIKGNPAILLDFVSHNKNPATVSETDSTYTLKASEITIALGKKTGQLLNIRNSLNDYQLSFNNGPVPAEGKASVDSSRTYKAGNNTVVEFLYSGTLKSVRWLMDASGWVTMEYEYNLEGEKPFTGISFNYPENYVLGAKWLGKGPVRQWKNRMAGTELNVWQNLYNNTHTGYSPIQYPEFKGYYGEVVMDGIEHGAG